MRADLLISISCMPKTYDQRHNVLIRQLRDVGVHVLQTLERGMYKNEDGRNPAESVGNPWVRVNTLREYCKNANQSCGVLVGWN